MKGDWNFVSRNKKLMHLEHLCFYWDLHIKVNYTCFHAFSVNLSTEAGLKKTASKPLVFSREKGPVPRQVLPLQKCTACSSDHLTSSARCDALVFTERSTSTRSELIQNYQLPFPHQCPSVRC